MKKSQQAIESYKKGNLVGNLTLVLQRLDKLGYEGDETITKLEEKVEELKQVTKMDILFKIALFSFGLLNILLYFVAEVTSQFWFIFLSTLLLMMFFINKVDKESNLESYVKTISTIKELLKEKESLCKQIDAE